jgi:hypothetical protein
MAKCFFNPGKHPAALRQARSKFSSDERNRQKEDNRSQEKIKDRSKAVLGSYWPIFNTADRSDINHGKRKNTQCAWDSGSPFHVRFLGCYTFRSLLKTRVIEQTDILGSKEN